MKYLTALAALSVLTVVTMCLKGCPGIHPDYEVALPNGYALARANPYDIAICDQRRIRVVPPRVASLGVWGDLVFGQVEASHNPSLEDDDEWTRAEKARQEKAIGYFLINTKTHEVRLGLAKDAWLAALHESGVPGEPKLRKPSRWFRY